MTRTDERGTSDQQLIQKSNKSRWSLIALACFVALGAFAIRKTIPDQTADAQVRAPQSARPKTNRQTPPPGTRQTPPPRQNAGGSPTNISAVVNGDPITRQFVGQQCLTRWGVETLESLVNKALIGEACQSRGIVITDRDVDNEVESIGRQFGMSTDQYLKMLKNERGVTETEYKRDIIWPRFALKRLAAEKLTVTKEQLDKEKESQYGPKVSVRMISLTNAKKAQEVLQLAKANPKDFGQLAKQYSEDPNTASAKGLIPPVRKHMGEPAIEAAVFALKEGEISNVVQAANQYFVFKCERHIPASRVSPQYAQQIETQLRDKIVENNLRSASTDILEKLQQQAKVVNVLNDPKLRKQSPGVAAFVNNKQISMKELVDECMLRYGRMMVETEINYKLLSQALKLKNLNVSQAAINDEIARAALAFGYLKTDGSADVNSWIAAVTKQEGVGVKEYVRDAVWPSVALKQLVGSQVSVTQEDLKKGFEANYGERVEVLAIVLSNQRIAQEVWDMARKDPGREFFGRLAEQYSIEPTSRANYGEVPPIRRHGGQPLIEKEAFGLNPNDELKGLSAIVATGDKYIIMKCLGRTKPVVEDITDVQNELEKDIREKKLRLAMSDEFDRLRSAAQIDNFEAGTSQAGKSFGPQKPRGKVQARQASTKKKVHELILPGRKP